MRVRTGVRVATWVAGTIIAFAVPFLVAYTEIDWKAYMQEVEGPFVHGVWDYELLRGDTGPLVYPAGFVYVFELLRRWTSEGKDIHKAQLIFAGIHSLLLGLVLLVGLYQRTDSTPVWAVPLAALSRRTHSIFSLRLFNDGVAMLFAYAGMLGFLQDYWTLGCMLFSFGVGIKMNVLLMSPAVAVLLVRRKGWLGFAWRVGMMGAIQVALGYPFMLVNLKGYLVKSFELGRVFDHQWTTNYKFLPPDVFVRPELSMGLLACTLVTWLAFGHARWTKSGLIDMVFKSSLARGESTTNLSSDLIVTSMLESNLIGIVFARSLHYQFFCWYSHGLPYLIWRGGFFRGKPWSGAGVLVWLAIEVCFNVFPATPWSSLLLHFCHVVLLVSAWRSPRPGSLQEGGLNKETKVE